MVVNVQFNTPLVAVATEGAIVFCVIAVVVVVLQPLSAVTVKLYVPGKFMVGLAVAAPAVIPGPVHAYVPPPVAVKLADKFVHVKVLELLVAVITGVVVF
jgi:hypothetical protein